MSIVLCSFCDRMISLTAAQQYPSHLTSDGTRCSGSSVTHDSMAVWNAINSAAMTPGRN